MAINEVCYKSLFCVIYIVLTVFSLIVAVGRQNMTYYFRDIY